LLADGGGIRGYVLLLILDELAHAISTYEIKLEAETCQCEHPSSFDPGLLRLSDYFDYIYGTSTGGITAVMLGRLNMTVKQSLEVYRGLSSTVFHRRQLVGYLPFATRYSSKNFEEASRQIVMKYCDGTDVFAKGTNQCHTYVHGSLLQLSKLTTRRICVTATHGGEHAYKPFLLRTHTSHLPSVPAPALQYNRESSKLPISGVLRATSAAPCFFKPYSITLNGKRIRFKDGGIRANNPSQVAWNEHQGQHKTNPALLLSIGTGQSEHPKDGFSAGGKPGHIREMVAIWRDIIDKYTSSEIIHQTMLGIAGGETSWYRRLNPSSGVGDIRLDELKRGLWTDPATGQKRYIPGGKTLSKMESGTREYLDRDFEGGYETSSPPMDAIHQIAEKLVRLRRAKMSVGVGVSCSHTDLVCSHD
ncbi:acyl transferase/acyl hydrolase/lysophospholipase, partial [Lophiotrema nucula]